MKEKKWKELGSLNKRRLGPGLCQVDDKDGARILYCFGGFDLESKSNILTF